MKLKSRAIAPFVATVALIGGAIAAPANGQSAAVSSSNGSESTAVVRDASTSSLRALSPMLIDSTFSSDLATFNWANVAKAKYYKIGFWPGSFVGPIYGKTRVKASTFSKSLASMPIDNAGVAVIVEAYNSNNKTIAGSGKLLRVQMDGTAIDATGDSNAALDKAKQCLKEGAVAAVGTAVGTGWIAAATVWIPGVDVVTTGGFAVATAAMGAGAVVACVVVE